MSEKALVPPVKPISSNPQPAEIQALGRSLSLLQDVLNKAGLLGNTVWASKDFVSKAVATGGGGGSALLDAPFTAVNPTTPTGLTVTGTFGGIILDWDIPAYTGHAYTEIHRASTDDIGQAVMVGQSYAAVAVDKPPDHDLDTVYYYWIRHINRNNVVGPWNATPGTEGKTGTDYKYAVQAMLKSQWRASFPYVPNELLTPTEWNGYAYEVQPPGGVSAATEPTWPTVIDDTVNDGDITYKCVSELIYTEAMTIGLVNGVAAVAINKAFIQDASITNAMIANLAVDAAKIANGTIVEAKIAAAQITSALIADFIQSDNYDATNGWQIRRDDGEATFRGLTVTDPQGNAILRSTSGLTGIDPNSFIEYFDHADNLDDWQRYGTGGGELNHSATDGVTGGGKLKVGDSSGDDEAWLIHRKLIPFDPKRTYRIKARIKRPSGSGTIYVGFAGVGEDGTTLVNASGADTHSSQHYHCASNSIPGGSWTEFEGFTEGHGATVGTTAIGTLASPGEMHPDVRYLRPLILVNYNAAVGQTDIDSLVIDSAPGGTGAFAFLDQITAANISTYIADLAVDTLHLAGQAVTFPKGTEIDTNIRVGNWTSPGSYEPGDKKIISHLVPTTGAPVYMVFSCVFERLVQRTWVRFKRNGTTLRTLILNKLETDQDGLIFSHSLLDDAPPVSGSLEYAIHIESEYQTNANSLSRVEYSTLWTLELKK